MYFNYCFPSLGYETKNLVEIMKENPSAYNNFKFWINYKFPSFISECQWKT